MTMERSAKKFRWRPYNFPRSVTGYVVSVTGYMNLLPGSCECWQISDVEMTIGIGGLCLLWKGQEMLSASGLTISQDEANGTARLFVSLRILQLVI